MPLTLRITKDRKTSFVYLGQAIKESDWDEKNQRVKKSHPNSVRLNNFLTAKLAEANDKALELGTLKEIFSVKAVKNKIKRKAGSTFFAQANSYLDGLKQSGKYNQYTSDKSRINNFKTFIGGDIAFSDITPSLLERFNGYARATLKLNPRTAVNQLVTIRSVFSQAIKDNAHRQENSSRLNKKLFTGEKRQYSPKQLKRESHLNKLTPCRSPSQSKM